MTAFGPYKYSETIDFAELEQNHLFVISGNTGAGKTTIFDGISFALYGSASGSDRENQAMLRSDFAEDDTHTSVELEFELHGRVYRILRQLGHVKKGNKSKTGEKYEFYEKLDDKEIPCVDRQIVTEIDKKVESIIGLTKDQFKQIVMLPQGEFRKLLTSETENKEEILRRIFKTESYKQIGERLKQRKQQAHQNFNQQKQLRDQHIQSIHTSLPEREGSQLFQVLSEEHYNVNQVVSGLEEEVNFYLHQIEIDQKKYDDAYKLHNQQQDKYYQAKALNDRFIELDQKKVRLKELEEQIPRHEENEKKLADAERASTIEVYERQVNNWQQEEKQKSILLEKAGTAKKQADEQLQLAQETYREQEDKKEERENVRNKLDRLKDMLPMVQELDSLKKQLFSLKNKAKQAHTNFEQIKAEVEQKNKAAEDNRLKIKELDERTTQFHVKQQQYTELKEKGRLLLSYIHLINKIAELEKDAANKEKDYAQCKEAYREKEDIWLNSQASILAEHLHDGEACPVCGNTEHPDKAINDGKIITKEELNALKIKLDEKESLYRKAAGMLEANVANKEEKETELLQYGIQSEEAIQLYDEVVKQGKQLKAEVEQLTKLDEDLRKRRESSEKELSAIKQLEAKKEELDKAFQKQKEEYHSSKIRYEERLKNIPESVRELAVLEKVLHETSEYKLKLEQSWEKAQKQLQKAKEEETKTAANLKHAMQQLEETKEKKEQAEKAFQTQLSDAGFVTVQSYQQAKISYSDRQQLKESIQRFKEEISTVKQQVHDLQDALKEKERVDLTKLEQTLTELKHASESALNQLNLSKKYYQESAKIVSTVIELDELVRNYEKQLATITDLHDIIRGQNDKRISFERYLQIEYLERIIEAANQRLKRLSNGQFYLIRSDRQESHGKQSGLGLDVYDTYTGQTRDVKTLSGGEKFNASLCLALGMSDVIQSFQGNISIDTMFIDEGFGSLDEEALNKSIDTLIELQQTGRMIGVISHVQDLKNMFPAILEVAKTKEGYSKTRFVLK